MSESFDEYPERLEQVNTDMDTLLAERSDELEEFIAGGKQSGNVDEIHDNTKLSNLPRIAKQIRKRKAHRMLNKILPAVKRAAYKGNSSVHITSKSRELSELSSELAPMLYRYGVHSVVASPREFVVNILKDERTNWSGEYINDDYVEPASPSHNTDGDFSDNEV
jgi:hypothetical protein